MHLRAVAVGTLLFCGIARAPHAADQAPRPISITAQRFYFSPNEIKVKKGEQVTSAIQFQDVSHGLLIEGLGVRTEVKKGKTAEVSFTPESTGTVEGKCAHFCGSAHGSMKFTVYVTE